MINPWCYARLLARLPSRAVWHVVVVIAREHDCRNNERLYPLLTKLLGDLA